AATAEYLGHGAVDPRFVARHDLRRARLERLAQRPAFVDVAAEPARRAVAAAAHERVALPEQHRGRREAERFHDASAQVGEDLFERKRVFDVERDEPDRRELGVATLELA